MTVLRKIIIIVASVVMTVAIGVFALYNFWIPTQKYNNALFLMQSEEYSDALVAFEEVKAFRDSAVKIEECKQAIKEETYLDARSAEILSKFEQAFNLYASLGDYKDSLTRKERVRINLQSKSFEGAKRKSTVYFGSYEQDNNLENGKEPIKWYVISTNGNYLQLLAVNALDAKQYHSEYKAVTWEKSDLRTWLNDEFYSTAFTRAEQNLIVPWWITSEQRDNQGTTVMDKVFLLSRDDVNNVVSGAFRACIPTPYALARGVYKSPDSEHCRWILRTPGEFMFNVVVVYFDGTFFARGNDVNYEKDGLRPSIWVNKSTVTT